MFSFNTSSSLPYPSLPLPPDINNENFNLASDLKKSKNPLCFKILKSLADNGFVAAIYELSQCYLEGLGTDVNTTKATEYILNAAKEGYEPAIEHLKQIYNTPFFDITDLNSKLAVGTAKKLEQTHTELALSLFTLAAKKKNLDGLEGITRIFGMRSIDLKNRCDAWHEIIDDNSLFECLVDLAIKNNNFDVLIFLFDLIFNDSIFVNYPNCQYKNLAYIIATKLIQVKDKWGRKDPLKQLSLEKIEFFSRLTFLEYLQAIVNLSDSAKEKIIRRYLPTFKQFSSYSSFSKLVVAILEENLSDNENVDKYKGINHPFALNKIAAKESNKENKIKLLEESITKNESLTASNQLLALYDFAWQPAEFTPLLNKCSRILNCYRHKNVNSHYFINNDFNKDYESAKSLRIDQAQDDLTDFEFFKNWGKELTSNFYAEEKIQKLKQFVKIREEYKNTGRWTGIVPLLFHINIKYASCLEDHKKFFGLILKLFLKETEEDIKLAFYLLSKWNLTNSRKINTTSDFRAAVNLICEQINKYSHLPEAKITIAHLINLNFIDGDKAKALDCIRDIKHNSTSLAKLYFLLSKELKDYIYYVLFLILELDDNIDDIKTKIGKNIDLNNTKLNQIAKILNMNLVSNSDLKFDHLKKLVKDREGAYTFLKFANHMYRMGWDDGAYLKSCLALFLKFNLPNLHDPHILLDDALEVLKEKADEGHTFSLLSLAVCALENINNVDKSWIFKAQVWLEKNPNLAEKWECLFLPGYNSKILESKFIKFVDGFLANQIKNGTYEVVNKNSKLEKLISSSNHKNIKILKLDTEDKKIKPKNQSKKVNYSLPHQNSYQESTTKVTSNIHIDKIKKIFEKYKIEFIDEIETHSKITIKSQSNNIQSIPRLIKKYCPRLVDFKTNGQVLEISGKKASYLYNLIENNTFKLDLENALSQIKSESVNASTTVSNEVQTKEISCDMQIWHEALNKVFLGADLTYDNMNQFTLSFEKLVDKDIEIKPEKTRHNQTYYSIYLTKALIGEVISRASRKLNITPDDEQGLVFKIKLLDSKPDPISMGSLVSSIKDSLLSKAKETKKTFEPIITAPIQSQLSSSTLEATKKDNSDSTTQLNLESVKNYLKAITSDNSQKFNFLEIEKNNKKTILQIKFSQSPSIKLLGKRVSSKKFFEWVFPPKQNQLYHKETRLLSLKPSLLEVKDTKIAEFSTWLESQGEFFQTEGELVTHRKEQSVGDIQNNHIKIDKLPYYVKSENKDVALHLTKLSQLSCDERPKDDIVILRAMQLHLIRAITFYSSTLPASHALKETLTTIRNILRHEYFNIEWEKDYPYLLLIAEFCHYFSSNPITPKALEQFDSSVQKFLDHGAFLDQNYPEQKHPQRESRIVTELAFLDELYQELAEAKVNSNEQKIEGDDYLQNYLTEPKKLEDAILMTMCIVGALVGNSDDPQHQACRQIYRDLGHDPQAYLEYLKNPMIFIQKAFSI